MTVSARGDNPPLCSPGGLPPELPAPDRRFPSSGGPPREASGAPRDRDSSGRPRNARPRDELGRPLPPGAPSTDPIPDDLSLPPAESLALAQQLLDRGRAFQAHEVLEASWKQAPTTERELWRGLAQLAVGLTHAQRGNARGATALLRRGAERVGQYAGTAPYGIDAAGLSQAATALADRIEASGLAGLEVPHLTLTH
jgi:hypothetical protein